MSKNFLHKLICPVISSLTTMIAILLIFIACILPIVAGQALKQSESFHLITERIDERINNCGKDFWISLIIVDGKKKQYRFHDVRGFNDDSSAIISVKHSKLNTFYSEMYKIDAITFSFLDKFEHGETRFYDDMSFFNDKYSARQIINATNKRIYKTGISVTKDIFNNVIYVFVATITDNHYNKCSKDKIIEYLKDISIYAKGI